MVAASGGAAPAAGMASSTSNVQGFRPGRPQVKPPMVGGPPPLPGEAHGSQTKSDADVERTSNALAATAKAQLADAEEQLAWQLAEFLDLGKRFPTLPASWFRPDFLQTESPTSGLGESVMAGSFLLVQGVRRRVCVRVCVQLCPPVAHLTSLPSPSASVCGCLRVYPPRAGLCAHAKASPPCAAEHAVAGGRAAA